MRVAPAREDTCSLVKMWLRCRSTVFSLRTTEVVRYHRAGPVPVREPTAQLANEIVPAARVSLSRRHDEQADERPRPPGGPAA
jgi:hypothetical protein